jgi:predicted TIM-barrel fold metal-dependent hydrolase
MKPLIDVHEHIFRGKDIPLKGYLLSRSYPCYIKILGPLLFSIIAQCIRRKEREEKRGFLCRVVLEIAYKYMGEGYRRWADILSMTDWAEITAKMLKTFEKDKIDLYVPLMIDYEYWFKNSRDTYIASQINRIYKDVIRIFKGKIHPFAPFDPARELAHRAGMPGPDFPDNGPPEKHSSLELVKDAVRNKGFIGVKVYNTLGYKPLMNGDVDKKRRSIFRRNKMSRYAVFSGEEFDKVLEELYEFCVEEQVPITAHCVSTGIEAYPGASFDFGSPVYWRAVLEKYPDLHLNLGHFGWSPKQRYLKKSRLPWKGFVRRKKSWVREICEMLDDYKYLFVDVAHHEVILKKKLANFKTNYEAIVKDFPGLIQKRILFGIDWHVITRVDNFTHFKDIYVNLFKDVQHFSDEAIADFLGGNALRFLGLLPLNTKKREGWMKNRKRLKSFYQKNRIDPPAWFKTTA